MKKQVFLLSVLLLSTLATTGQSHFDSDISQIRLRMEFRDSIYDELRTPKVKIDTLLSQLDDANLCVSLYEKENACLSDSLAIVNSELELFRLLTTPDTTIFHVSLSRTPIPQCLESHFSIINKIVELRAIIDNLETRVNEIKRTIKLANVNDVISAEIADNIQNAYSLIDEIKDSDLSSLSEEQKQYFKPGLTERYNNFSIYFEQ